MRRGAARADAVQSGDQAERTAQTTGEATCQATGEATCQATSEVRVREAGACRREDVDAGFEASNCFHVKAHIFAAHVTASVLLDVHAARKEKAGPFASLQRLCLTKYSLFGV